MSLKHTLRAQRVSFKLYSFYLTKKVPATSQKILQKRCFFCNFLLIFTLDYSIITH